MYSALQVGWPFASCTEQYPHSCNCHNSIVLCLDSGKYNCVVTAQQANQPAKHCMSLCLKTEGGGLGPHLCPVWGVVGRNIDRCISAMIEGWVKECVLTGIG